MKKNILLTIAMAVLVGTTGTLSSTVLAQAHEGVDHTATSTEMTASHGYNVMVMKHLCNASIKNIEDFKALEAGKDPVAALANTVLNCPTTGLPGDEAVAGTVASPRMTYDFKVMGEHHDDMWLSTDGEFMKHKLSEADINLDVNGDGTIASSTALDVSHYEFPHVMADNGRIEVTESQAPTGFKFGALRFTPPVIDGNNDQQSLLAIDDVQGRIQLNMTQDSDKMVMLHVYNFMTGDSSTSTPENSNDRSTIISEIRSLQNQIQQLQNKIVELLGQLF